MQNNSVRNHLTSQPSLISDENKTLNTETYLKRDRYGSHVYGLPTIAYNEAQGIPDESIDAKVSQQHQGNQETDEAPEEDMEIGYEDTPPTPTYEGLEQRFIDEIMKIVRERSDKEDAELARHNKRIVEINEEFQEKLSSLRALQETRREEFLQKELQARTNQYQDGKRNHVLGTKVADANGYLCPSTTFTAAEPTSSTRFHGSAEFLTTSKGLKTSQRNETRVPLPPGRVYNNSSVYKLE